MLTPLIGLVLLCQSIYSVSSQRIPQNPCPEVFQYYRNSQGTVYGEATVPYDGSFKLFFSINASFPTIFENKNLKIQLPTPPRNPTSTRQLKYLIYFPFSNLIPRITQITYNGRVFCSGPAEPLVAGGNGVTNTWSAHMFEYSIGYGGTNFVDNSNIGNPDDSGISIDDIPIKDPGKDPVQTPERHPEFTNENSGIYNNPFLKPSFTPTTSSTSRPTPPPTSPPTPPPTTRPTPPPTTRPTPPHTQRPSIAPVSDSGVSPATIPDIEISLDLTPVDVRERENTKCGIPSTGIVPLILGGTQTHLGQYPWLAAMYRYDEGYTYICSANLISDKHVVTAGRCVAYYKAQIVATKNILFVLGTNDLKHWTTNGATTRGASGVQVHPDFMKDSPYSANADVAVITLDKPVTFSERIRHICLWNFSESLYEIVNKRGTVAGWGKDESNATTYISKFTEMPVVSQFDCLKADEAFRDITSDNTFCAGDRRGNGPCVGDSGAGFMVPMNGVYYLRGIASLGLKKGDSCSLEDKYAVFCDIAKFSNWLKEAM